MTLPRPLSVPSREVLAAPLAFEWNERLLETFWQSHDPTQLNRQGPDYGTQYRSAIFYHTTEQAAQARASKTQLEGTARHGKPIVTEITPASIFYPAEEYHQRYFEKHGLSHCKTP